MKPMHLIQIFLIIASIIGFSCDKERQTENNKASEGSGDYASQELCDAVKILDASLDALEDSESLSEFKNDYAKVKQDFQTVKKAAGAKYETECNAFEKALNEFEASLNSFDDGGLISGLIELSSSAAELAAAGEILDEAIDCPGI